MRTTTKIKFSVVVSAALVLALLDLLQVAEGARAGRGARGRQARARGQGPGARGQGPGARGQGPPRKPSRGSTRKLKLSMDPALVNPPDVASPLPSMSLSPWTYDSTYDASRFPHRIFEATCERTGCVAMAGFEDLGLESKPIYYQVLVLRKRRRGRRAFLELGSQSVRVGCTCVLPQTVPLVQREGLVQV